MYEHPKFFKLRNDKLSKFQNNMITEIEKGNWLEARKLTEKDKKYNNILDEHLIGDHIPEQDEHKIFFDIAEVKELEKRQKNYIKFYLTVNTENSQQKIKDLLIAKDVDIQKT